MPTIDSIQDAVPRCPGLSSNLSHDRTHRVPCGYALTVGPRCRFLELRPPRPAARRRRGGRPPRRLTPARYEAGTASKLWEPEQFTNQILFVKMSYFESK